LHRNPPATAIVIDATLVYGLCIVFIATVIRSALGFGEAPTRLAPMIKKTRENCLLSEPVVLIMELPVAPPLIPPVSSRFGTPR
jgi:hypothetical protein